MRSNNIYGLRIGKERKFIEGKLRSRNIFGIKIGKERKMLLPEVIEI